MALWSLTWILLPNLHVKLKIWRWMSKIAELSALLNQQINVLRQSFLSTGTYYLAEVLGYADNLVTIWRSRRAMKESFLVTDEAFNKMDFHINHYKTEYTGARKPWTPNMLSSINIRVDNFSNLGQWCVWGNWRETYNSKYCLLLPFKTLTK